MKKKLLIKVLLTASMIVFAISGCNSGTKVEGASSNPAKMYEKVQTANVNNMLEYIMSSATKSFIKKNSDLFPADEVSDKLTTKVNEHLVSAQIKKQKTFGTDMVYMEDLKVSQVAENILDDGTVVTSFQIDLPDEDNEQVYMIYNGRADDLIDDKFINVYALPISYGKSSTNLLGTKVTIDVIIMAASYIEIVDIWDKKLNEVAGVYLNKNENVQNGIIIERGINDEEKVYYDLAIIQDNDVFAGYVTMIDWGKGLKITGVSYDDAEDANPGKNVCVNDISITISDGVVTYVDIDNNYYDDYAFLNTKFFLTDKYLSFDEFVEARNAGKQALEIIDNSKATYPDQSKETITVEEEETENIAEENTIVSSASKNKFKIDDVLNSLYEEMTSGEESFYITPNMDSYAIYFITCGYSYDYCSVVSDETGLYFNFSGGEGSRDVFTVQWNENLDYVEVISESGDSARFAGSYFFSSPMSQ